MLVTLGDLNPKRLATFPRRTFLYLNNSGANALTLFTNKEDAQLFANAPASSRDGVAIPAATQFANWWDGDLWVVGAAIGQQFGFIAPGADRVPQMPERTANPGELGSGSDSEDGDQL